MFYEYIRVLFIYKCIIKGYIYKISFELPKIVLKV